MKVFISSQVDEESREIVRALRAMLSERNFEPFSLGDEILSGDKFHVVRQDGLEQCDALLVIFNRELSSYQQSEVNHFMRQALRATVRKPIIPIVKPSSVDLFARSRLADYLPIVVGESNLPIRKQLEPVLARLATAGSGVEYTA